MQALEQILAEQREALVEDLAYQLSCLRSAGCSRCGPAEISSRVMTLVEAFLESVAARRVTPFVDEVRAVVSGVRGDEALPAAEVHMVLDLLEDHSARHIAANRDRARAAEDLGVVHALVKAGRDVVPRESRFDPGP